MTCNELKAVLDDYVDGELPTAAALTAHIETCEDCRSLLDRERELRESLKDYGEVAMPRMDAAFFDRAMINATRAGTKRQRNRWVMTGAAGAIAAGLVMWMLGGVMFDASQPVQPATAAIVMTLEEPRTVNLVFSSARALENATMTVTLPQGLELSGFAGRREITWMTSLGAGRNVLPLTLVATSSDGGELTARLHHSGEDRTFRVKVNVLRSRNQSGV